MNFRSINWSVVIVIIILLVTIGIFIWITKLEKKNSLLDTQKVLVNPVNNPFKTKDCRSVRTACNPKDPNSCNNSCDEQELKCVILDNINPSGATASTINGGGAVCLPDYPKIECDVNHGGVYVWTGYGFTDNQTWDCYCSYPEFFGGPACKNANADICSGGTINEAKMASRAPNSELCICPEGTVTMLRGQTNTPYCGSQDPTKGGGDFGLVGDVFSSPDWHNVFFRTNTSQAQSIIPITTSDWAKLITCEVTASQYSLPNGTSCLSPSFKGDANMASQITSVFDKYQQVHCATCINGAAKPCSNYCLRQQLITLNNELADQICSIACPNACNNLCDCSTKKAKWSSELDALNIKARYSYFPEDSLPEKACNM